MICRRIASRASWAESLSWRRDDMGMWIALIRFNHPVEAQSCATAWFSQFARIGRGLETRTTAGLESALLICCRAFIDSR